MSQITSLNLPEPYILRWDQLKSEIDKKLPELTGVSNSFSKTTGQLIEWDKNRSVLEIDQLREHVALYRQAEKVAESVCPLLIRLIKTASVTHLDQNNYPMDEWLKISNILNEPLGKLSVSLPQARKALANLIFRFKTQDSTPIPYLKELVRWLFGHNYLDEMKKAD
ncbi:MAG: hypothetical protein A3E80_00495 [Chlamydiae bacterium RIFCSPHIGHO2_12_FULL_49_9]|nr:MAG: hypothetical protein A3E80_00495 [Chlamydiae bacterium RIFCSPHIGHO2_12_FULL_49_9]